MQLSKLLLFPFTILYSLVMKLRNLLYEKNWRKSVQFETNVITVGNLEVGGTGKTPTIEYLIRLLSSHKKVAVLSRGYRRKSKGFILADETSTAEVLGDEPFQIFSKLGKSASVAVGESRETAIPFILAEKPETQVVLLDDAYQYRTVIPSFSILLTRFDRPFYRDIILPAGRLRESRSEAKRADLILVTKCPSDINDEVKREIQGQISEYSKAPVYFSGTEYMDPLFISGERAPIESVVLVTGIAHPDTLVDFISSKYKLLKHFRFVDHHYYSDRDIRRVVDYASQNKASILMTEKDASKWKSKYSGAVPLYSMPISIKILENGTQFDDMVISSIKEYELPY